MIKIFKNFTKKKLAGLLLIFVIIIAFGFGGFGGGFSTGNQNNIAKINNTKISTQDFMDYLNKSGLSQNVIKENIDKKIIEELLSTLISTKILDLEIKDLKLEISEKTIIKKLKESKNFHGENGKFQRTLYEKFLLTNNISAPIYELRLKNNALQKQLFTYISGGAKSPNFLVNKFFKDKNRKLEIEYINLNKFYKKKSEFTDQDIKNFVEENSKNLKQDYIDFSYVIINPKILTGIEEFNQTFFDEIDNIENKIAKNIDFKTIIKELNITAKIEKNYINLENKKTTNNTIYNAKENSIDILEDNGQYIFYQIDRIVSKLPDLNDNKFKTQITKLLFQKNKFDFNKTILEQISKKEFDQSYFDKFAKEGSEKIKLNSIKDDKKFEINSVEILYSMSINSFTLIADNKNNVFIAKNINFEEKNITQTSKKFNSTLNEASAKNRNTILNSYDYLLNDKYKVVINQPTLDRVKNYFK
jgi:peptidyl-prolyl cis-trans isomerase D